MQRTQSVPLCTPSWSENGWFSLVWFGLVGFMAYQPL